jgi:hypothetical protein
MTINKDNIQYNEKVNVYNERSYSWPRNESQSSSSGICIQNYDSEFGIKFDFSTGMIIWRENAQPRYMS